MYNIHNRVNGHPQTLDLIFQMTEKKSYKDEELIDILKESFENKWKSTIDNFILFYDDDNIKTITVSRQCVKSRYTPDRICLA